MQTHRLNEMLPPAPATVVTATGEPAFGTYAGIVPRVQWQGLQGAYERSGLWTLLHHKRWQYVGIAAADCYIGLAIIDTGWATSCFAYLFDRPSRSVTGAFSAMGLPGVSAMVGPAPGDGAHSFFRSLTGTVRVERAPGTAVYRVRVAAGGFAVDAEVRASNEPTLSAIVPIAQGVANCTHKSPALTVRGHATAGGQRYALQEALAALDHTDGLLARETRWQWASARGSRLGFNLQAGFNGDHENALWLDGQLIPLAAATFAYDQADPMAPWRITTADGLVALTFTPEGVRREDKELLVAMSRYVQPIGTFSGTVRAHPDDPAVAVTDLLGVTEDHQARW